MPHATELFKFLFIQAGQFGIEVFFHSLQLILAFFFFRAPSALVRRSSGLTCVWHYEPRPQDRWCRDAWPESAAPFLEQLEIAGIRWIEWVWSFIFPLG